MPFPLGLWYHIVQHMIRLQRSGAQEHCLVEDSCPSLSGHGGPRWTDALYYVYLQAQELQMWKN